MNHDFTEYLPYIVITLLIVSGVAIVERGSFEKKIEKEVATPTPISSVLPSASPTGTPGPTVPPELQELTAPTPTPAPIITTKPSINRPRGGEDDN